MTEIINTKINRFIFYSLTKTKSFDLKQFHNNLNKWATTKSLINTLTILNYQESNHNQIIKSKQDLPLLKAIHGKLILT